MPDYVAALDQGTTSTRFIVFDRTGRIAASAQKEHEQIYPQPVGWNIRPTRSGARRRK
jgi:glycerol kinase